MSVADRVEAALNLIPNKDNPSNGTVLAECIRQELQRSFDTGDTAGAAEHRIANMLSNEFVNKKVVRPFRLLDRELFSRWTVTVQCPVGEPFVVDQNS